MAAGGLCPVRELVGRLEGTAPETIGKRQLTDAADALARLSVGMAPDPRFALRSPKGDEPVVLFNLPEGTTRLEAVSERYRSLLLSVAIGSFVAHADEVVGASELRVLSEAIDADSVLTEGERSRLKANLQWLSTVRPDLPLLRRHFRNAPQDAAHEMGQLALSIAASDGVISAKEISALERLYQAIGLEKDGIYSALHALASEDEPVTVIPPSAGPAGFAIPGDPDLKGTLTLDEEKIAAVMANTARVSALLDEVFQVEEEQDATALAGEASEPEGGLEGLDRKHAGFLGELISRPHWDEEEFRNLAHQFRLLPAGAAETLNEWSFERFGDLLVEQENGYQVNSGLKAKSRPWWDRDYAKTRNSDPGTGRHRRRSQRRRRAKSGTATHPGRTQPGDRGAAQGHGPHSGRRLHHQVHHRRIRVGKDLLPQPGQTDRHGETDGRPLGRHLARPKTARNRRTGPFTLRRDGPEYIHPDQAGRWRHALRGGTVCHGSRERRGEDGTKSQRRHTSKLAHLEEMVGGYDFAAVIARYWEGYDTDNEELKSSALRWLRGEYSTRTEARRDLGVRTIVDDASLYDQLKLMAAFAKEAGYQGVVVSLDEMVNLYKLVSSQARQSNYEQILRILNDVLQGTAQHIGFLMGGTPEFLMDTRRGLYSYAALQSRLAENSFARDGMVDLRGPVIRLANLTPEDMFVLLTNIRRVMQDEDTAVPDEALTAFMTHCSTRIGDAYFRTPRNTVKEFVNMLSVLEQNPGTGWRDLVGSLEPETDSDPNAGTGEMDDDELESFRL